MIILNVSAFQMITTAGGGKKKRGAFITHRPINPNTVHFSIALLLIWASLENGRAHYYNSVRFEKALKSQPRRLLRSQEGVSGEVLQPISAQLLLFHSPILKPNFNLTVGQVQHAGKLKPFLFVDVNVKEEFPLQLSNLKLGIWTPLLPGTRSA